jgi:hypothetical protein
MNIDTRFTREADLFATSTEFAAHWINAQAQERPDANIALIGPSHATIRDYMADALLSTGPKSLRPVDYQRSKCRLTYSSGAKAKTLVDAVSLHGWIGEIAWWHEPARTERASKVEKIVSRSLHGDDSKLLVTATA